jgi:hypothetical protein
MLMVIYVASYRVWPAIKEHSAVEEKTSPGPRHPQLLTLKDFCVFAAEVHAVCTLALTIVTDTEMQWTPAGLQSMHKPLKIQCSTMRLPHGKREQEFFRKHPVVISTQVHHKMRRVMCLVVNPRACDKQYPDHEQHQESAHIPYARHLERSSTSLHNPSGSLPRFLKFG